MIVNGPEGVYAVATEGPLTLAPGSSATIAATMTPGKAGTFNGTLTIQSDDADGDVVVSLIGVGTAWELTDGGPGHLRLQLR